MQKNQLSFLVGGAAGMGVKTAGMIFAKTGTRGGLHAFGNVEYPSIIRGGHNSFQIVFSDGPVHSHPRRLDVLLALDRLALDTQLDQVRPRGAVIFDSGAVGATPADLKGRDALFIDLPLSDMAKTEGLTAPAAINAVGLGAAMGLLKVDFDVFAGVLAGALRKLKPEVLKKNLEAARKGWERANKEAAPRFDMFLDGSTGLDASTVAGENRMVLTGNDALSMGAVQAGVQFYSGYPMTPSSSILAFMARHERELGMVVKHAEDEIAAIGMAVGASFAGVRAMTSTSGGGFCLMSEHVGLAAMTETPLVIAECQRPGPATGLPTRTAQGDLRFALSVSQDEFPRIVLAPGDPGECFEMGFEAFNLADRTQTPVILLLDKHLSESYWTWDPFDTTGLAVDRGEWIRGSDIPTGQMYRRHAHTPSGISPRLRPGEPGGIVLTTGDEHDEYGRITEEPRERTLQMEKRLRKTSLVDTSSYGMERHGPEEADLTLVGWGSTKGPILEAMGGLRASGVTCNFLQLRAMSPFPVHPVREALKRAGRAVLVENNGTGQLGGLIAEKTGVLLEEGIFDCSGRQFYTDELEARIRKIL
ncbi:MAG: 2-oxoacid:acceptor oxidoreductase subunit alpha [Planctomycetota bacterium]|jgi:2-oxoglutarate ferredoxin oxidoreductase subunit alpha